MGSFLLETFESFATLSFATLGNKKGVVFISISFYAYMNYYFGLCCILVIDYVFLRRHKEKPHDLNKLLASPHVSDMNGNL